MNNEMIQVGLQKLLKPVADYYNLLVHDDVAIKVIKQNKFITLIGVSFGVMKGYEYIYYNVFVKNLFVCDCSWNLAMTNSTSFFPDLEPVKESNIQPNIDKVKSAFEQLSNRITNLEDLPVCMADKSIGYWRWSVWNDGEEAMWRRLNTACTYLVLGEYDYAEKDLIALSELNVIPQFEYVLDKGKYLLKLLQNGNYMAIEQTLLGWQNDVIDALCLRDLFEIHDIIKN